MKACGVVIFSCVVKANEYQDLSLYLSSDCEIHLFAVKASLASKTINTATHSAFSTFLKTIHTNLGFPQEMSVPLGCAASYEKLIYL